MFSHRPLVIDIAGLALTELDKVRLKNPYVGGVIYFQRNWKNRQQLSQLSQSIKAIRPDLLIFIDHEGGRVQRLRGDGVSIIPSMSEISQMKWRDDDSVDEAYHQGHMAYSLGAIVGFELRALGVDLALGPVLDLDFDNRCPVLVGRTFSANAKTVAELAQLFMRGMEQSGMGNCGKHFPGHGYTNTDTHTGLAVDDRSLTQINSQDLIPYSILLDQGVLRAVMPSHVIYSQVDKLPAGFSSLWLQTILRNAMNFTGAIVSDDLGMAAAGYVEGEKISHAKANILALNAGCDVILVCNLSIRPSGAKREDSALFDVKQVPEWDFLSERSQLDDVLDEFDFCVKQGEWRLRDAEGEIRRRSLIATSPAYSWDDLSHCAVYQEAKNYASRMFLIS